MARVRDISGERFGKLVAREFTGRLAKNRSAIWLCDCDCGVVTEAPASRLIQPKQHSCGCSPSNKALEISIGDEFDRLTVISPAPSVRGGRSWNCVCSCGGRKVVTSSRLVRGNTRSCGCLVVETHATAHRTHHRSKTRTYRAWSNMRHRCCDVAHPSYENYGARGIQVCDRWAASFENFLADMGEAPPGLTLERVNNDKGYSPENCKWATRAEQNRNQRPRKDLIYLPDGRRVRKQKE